jgi:hypothetical protein
MLSAAPAESTPPTTVEPPPRAPHPTTFPFHGISGLSNFRDIGGWAIASSPDAPKHVRTGIFYRGSDTNHITREGEAKLRELGIVIDFDLRSREQISKTGGFKEMGGIERVWAPVFADSQYTETKTSQRYEQYAAEGTDVCAENAATDWRVMLTSVRA